LQFHYPGNIRELENIIKKAYVLSNGDKIQKKDIEIEEEEEEEETENVYQKMIFNGKSFWEVVHKPFLEREINRREAKRIITRGLKETGGSYKKLLAIFHIGQEEKDYKRFMKILTIHKLR
jgi:DNA-binding NtrC family response regulator